MESSEDSAREAIQDEPNSYEEEMMQAQYRVAKFVSSMTIANALGLIASLAIWFQFSDHAQIQNTMMTSAMVFAIGVATAIGSHFMFRSCLVLSREADRMRMESEGDEFRLAMARDRQTAAVGRVQSGMRPLKISGICFVASTMMGLTGLFSG